MGRLTIEEELHSMTKSKLLELAKSCDIETKSMSKEQLIEALRKFVCSPSKTIVDVAADTVEKKPPKLTPEFNADDNFVDAPVSNPNEDRELQIQMQREREERDFKLAELQLHTKLTADATAVN